MAFVTDEISASIRVRCPRNLERYARMPRSTAADPCLFARRTAAPRRFLRTAFFFPARVGRPRRPFFFALRLPFATRLTFALRLAFAVRFFLAIFFLLFVP